MLMCQSVDVEVSATLHAKTHEMTSKCIDPKLSKTSFYTGENWRGVNQRVDVGVSSRFVRPLPSSRPLF